jgi:protein kinase X
MINQLPRRRSSFRSDRSGVVAAARIAVVGRHLMLFILDVAGITIVNIPITTITIITITATIITIITTITIIIITAITIITTTIITIIITVTVTTTRSTIIPTSIMIMMVITTTTTTTTTTTNITNIPILTHNHHGHHHRGHQHNLMGFVHHQGDMQAMDGWMDEWGLDLSSSLRSLRVDMGPWHDITSHGMAWHGHVGKAPRT